MTKSLKIRILTGALFVTVLGAIHWVPGTTPYATTLSALTLIAGLYLLLLALLTRSASSNGEQKLPYLDTESQRSETDTVDTIKPAISPPDTTFIDAEILNFLGLLQEKGRFVDFAMGDITKFDDAQVGAAARVVHQGCARFIKEAFAIESVFEGEEGSAIDLPPDYRPEEYRLVGKVGGEAPFSGKVLHKGWKATDVRLPHLISATPRDPKRLVIAPAEVELS